MDLNTDPIYRLAANTAGSIGNEFLVALVHDLHEVMPVNLAMITESVGQPPRRVRALYSWKDGELGAPIEYDLEGTPCELVYQGQALLIPRELAVRFPKEPAHRRSYCGVPLRSRERNVTGHFAVISNEVIAQTQRVEGVVQIFGRRVEAELQRLRDNEEREELIRRLQQQHYTAREKNQFMAKVLGMVAHDLRNPLAAVVSRAELMGAILEKSVLAEEMLPSEKKLLDSVSAILKSTDRMEKMIADLIVAARKETTEIGLNSTTIPLHRPIKSAIQLYEDDAARKNIKISVDLGNLVQVTADEDRLIEAIGNLISNAVKYSTRGSRITITCRVEEADRFAKVVIADEGLGMTEQDIGAAFKVFRTLSAQPTDGETSTGLGLAIVKTIVEAHGGSIKAESQGRHKGTTMTLQLPVPPANCTS